MLTHKSKKIKDFFLKNTFISTYTEIETIIEELKNEYKEDCKKINPKELTCECGSNDIVRYGSRLRKFRIAFNNNDDKIILYVFKCKKCGRYHVLMPLFLVPYKQTTIFDFIIAMGKAYDDCKEKQIKNIRNIVTQTKQKLPDEGSNKSVVNWTFSDLYEIIEKTIKNTMKMLFQTVDKQCIHGSAIAPNINKVVVIW